MIKELRVELKEQKAYIKETENLLSMALKDVNQYQKELLEAKKVLKEIEIDLKNASKS